MSNLSKSLKKAGRRIEGAVKKTFRPEIPELPAAEETIIPIPDENELALESKRRRAKSSRTGRDSTILTEGLGG